jgi:signal transduction histidine kinase
MLRKLRTRLTLLYLGMAMLFVLAVGGGLYGLLTYYFQQSNDQALKYRLVQELHQSNAPIPPDLANISYMFSLSTLIPTRLNPTPTPSATHGSTGDTEVDDVEDHPLQISSPAVPLDEIDPAYQGELAPIFALGMDDSGKTVALTNPAPPPMKFDVAAGNAATVKGMDLRTFQLTNGTPVRLLTYKLPAGYSLGVIQIGRPLDDQVRLLHEFINGWLLLSAASLLLLGLISWLIAGRSIGPVQKAFDQQQTFVANASHELRTPLTLIRASAEMAERKTIRPSTRTLLKDVVSDTDYMSKLVEDLLLLSRLDSHKLTFERKPVNLDELFADIQRQSALVAEPKGIGVSAEGKKLTVQADDNRLKQLLWILVDNSMQHTPKGGSIRLDAKEIGKSVEITVSDTGAGIPSRHLPRVFERFYKAHREDQFDRTAGLGLSIAAGLVEGMRGKISIESEVGRGTRVKLTLDKG